MEFTAVCSIPSCDRKHYAKSYCKLHYKRVWKWGNPSAEILPKKIELHGLSDTPEYHIWEAMKARCNNERNSEFSYYGGRGIRVCERWHTFTNFLEDIGARPSVKHTIERVNNDKNYSCGRCDDCAANNWVSNCTWETRSTQTRNKRRLKPTQSGYKYISWTSSGNKWILRIKINDENKILGRFESLREAVMKRDEIVERLRLPKYDMNYNEA